MRYKNNKQKENEKVWAKDHTSSRECEWIQNGAVGGWLSHHRSGSEAH